MPKKIRYTAKIRRGLEHMRGLLIDALDDSKPPASRIVSGWKQSVQREFNAAMEWIEQETGVGAQEQPQDQQPQQTL